MKINIFAEPKGIIKILEVVFCICAFSVLVSYSSTMLLEVTCSAGPSTTQASTTAGISTTTSSITTTQKDSTHISTTLTASTDVPITTDTPTTSITSSVATTAQTTSASFTTPIYTTFPTTVNTSTSFLTTQPPLKIDYSIVISYPFRLSSASSSEKNCNGNGTSSLVLEDKTSSKAIFFVFVGVTSFIFALAMIPVYIFQDDILADVDIFPTIDLSVTGVLTIFWFCGSIAWAAGAANLKMYTGEQYIIDHNSDICYPDKCSFISGSINYAGPIVSAIFGFINLLLFGGNMWFTFKETSYHGSSDPS